MAAMKRKVDWLDRDDGYRERFSRGLLSRILCAGRLYGETKDVFAVRPKLALYVHQHLSSQKFDASGKNGHSIREGVVAGSVPQGAFQEHAGALANLQHRAARAILALTPVCGGVELDGRQFRYMPNAVGLAVRRDAGCTHVLAGQDVAPQVDCDAVGLVHAALLAQTGCRATASDGVDEAGGLAGDCLNVGRLAAADFMESQFAIDV